jgi:hypothetical protein
MYLQKARHLVPYVSSAVLVPVVRRPWAPSKPKSVVWHSYKASVAISRGIPSICPLLSAFWGLRYCAGALDIELSY